MKNNDVIYERPNLRNKRENAFHCYDLIKKILQHVFLGGIVLKNQIQQFWELL